MAKVSVATVAATSIAIAAIAAAVLAGQGVINYLSSQEPPTEPPTVTTSIAQGRVEASISGDFSVIPTQTWDVVAQGVVTQSGAIAGQLLDDGALVATVNARPTFVILGTVPSFRSLGVGTDGSDVAQLQAFLGRAGHAVSDQSGVYGTSTARAVFAFYTARGITPVDANGQPLRRSQSSSAGVPASEITFAPSFPVLPVDGCGTTGERVSGALCKLRTAAGQLVISVAERDSSAIGQGMTVQLDTATGVVEATIGARVEVAAASDASSDDGSEQANTQRTATFALDLAEGQAIPSSNSTGRGQVVVAASAPDAYLIEATAIREMSGARYWLETLEGDHLTVELGLCAEGFCEISGEGVEVGIEVVVPASLSSS